MASNGLLDAGQVIEYAEFLGMDLKTEEFGSLERRSTIHMAHVGYVGQVCTLYTIKNNENHDFYPR